MKLFGLLVAAATLTAAGAAHGDTCSQQALARTATLVLESQRDLGALPVGDGYETGVSVTGQTLIAALKNRLNAYVSASLPCNGGDVQPRTFGKVLDGLAGVKLPEDRLVAPGKHADDLHYGDSLKFEVRISQPDLIAIVARFGIECGTDAMLMIFERRGDAWTEVLRTQGAPYKTIAGGWETFDYGISPRDKAGQWFVATKNMAPWCSSTWSEIRYAVLRPGKDASHPRTLFSRSDSIWWGTDRYGDLKVAANSFDLRWRAESMDDGVHNREWIARYAVDGERVHRIPPIAENPRDFVDEWIRLDWKEAKDWTAVVAYGLRPLHDKLHKMRNFDYVTIRRCSGAGDHTQIEVEPTLATDDRHIFFEVGTISVLLLSDVSYSPHPNCNGPNLFSMDHPQ